MKLKQLIPALALTACDAQEVRIFSSLDTGECPSLCEQFRADLLSHGVDSKACSHAEGPMDVSLHGYTLYGEYVEDDSLHVAFSSRGNTVSFSGTPLEVAHSTLEAVTLPSSELAYHPYRSGYVARPDFANLTTTPSE